MDPMVTWHLSGTRKFIQLHFIGPLLKHAFSTDEVRKSSMKLADHILEKETSFSEEPHVSPFGSAFNTTQNTFAWLSQPENSFRLQRYGAAMAGTRLLFPANTILQGSPLALR